MSGKLYVVEGPEEKATHFSALLRNELFNNGIALLAINPFKHSLLASMMNDIHLSHNTFLLENGKELSSSDAVLIIDIRIAFVFNAIIGKVIPALASGHTVVLNTFIDNLIADNSQILNATEYITKRWQDYLETITGMPEDFTIIYCKPEAEDITDTIDEVHYHDYLTSIKSHTDTRLIELDTEDLAQKNSVIDIVLGKVNTPKKFKLVAV
jgi:hypothetical protein